MHAHRQNRHCTTGGAITSGACKTFSRQLPRLLPPRGQAKRGSKTRAAVRAPRNTAEATGHSPTRRMQPHGPRGRKRANREQRREAGAAARRARAHKSKRPRCMQELFDRCYAMKHCGVTLERPAGRREKAACYITLLCYPARVAPVAEDDCAR